MTKIKLTAVAGLALLLVASAHAQKKQVTPTEADRIAVHSAVSSAPKPFLANTKAAASYSKEHAAKPAAAASLAVPPFATGPRYPADLTYQGGPTVGQAQYHDIYVLNSAVGCNDATCWGNPEGFLKELGKSDFIHVVDQYTGRYESNRYKNGEAALALYNPVPAKFHDSDIQALVHSFAVGLGFPSGYESIFHVFLPPGTDICFNAPYDFECYSPDNPNTFYFCGYHGSVTFGDGTHVLYSVEPYENVGGCSVLPGSPNGTLIDSTNNVLSHETFETITDPDSDAWWNNSGSVLGGAEIGDECAYSLYFSPTDYGFNPTIWHVGQHTYATQPEYSNRGHVCTTSDEDNHGDD